MRRWIHSLIVALLCLTLFVDTAKACWFLRHRRRSEACRPVACRPVGPSPCCLPCPPVDTACDPLATEHLAADPTEDVVEFTVVEGGAAAGESVVEHGPTLVVGPKPSATAAANAPESVVTAPAAEKPAPIAAPLPIEQAAPAVPEAEGLAAREPLPDLKPAQPAGRAMVAPASNDEPVAEPAAATDRQAKASAAGDEAEDTGAPAVAEPPVAEQPMPAEPAPVADVAGAQDAKPAARAATPQEPNLFDLYGDEEADADAPTGEEAADAEEPEMIEEDSAEEDAAAGDDEGTEAEAASDETEETDATEEAEEMAEEAEGEEAQDATDEEASAAPADPETEDDADAAGEQPEDKPAAAEADPFAASFAVPDEPMRRWTDDTGTRHAQGWLVELHADRVRILKTNGRHTTVALESLSAADRDYVAAVGSRLAAERNGKSAAANATAGL